MPHAVRRGHRTPLALSRTVSRPPRATAASCRMSRVLGCGALATTLLGSGCAEPSPQRDATAPAASTAIERAKAERLAHEQQIARAVPSLTSIRLTQPRPFSLRDSGQNGAMAFLRDVDFRIVGNLGFYIHQLSATLVPTQAGAPIVFDDPTRFEIDVHQGMVTLDNAKLTALFNTYIFGYRNAPLRKLVVSAGDGVIHLQGEMQRDGWVPFSLTGTLAVRDGSQLVFHPIAVRVSGLDAQPVMRAANVKMADLLKVDTPIARLAGDDLATQQSALRDVRRHWEAFALAANDPRTANVPFNERHVSNRNPTIHLRNVDFSLSGDVGFHVDELDAQLVAKRAGEPVDLDDPNQYDIRILGGTVVESWKAMSVLFNSYLLDYSPRSLNDLQLSLRVQGGIKLWNHVPGVWLPTDMKGSLAVLDERHLAFTPTQVSVLAIPQATLLRSLGIELASLTPLRRRGAELRGDTLVLDQYTVFPPPILDGKLAQASVERDGLRLTFRRVPDAPAPKRPPIPAHSYMWLEGGDMKMFNVLELNLRALIQNSADAGPMRFDLYGYRSQVAQGSVRMLPDGTLVVDLGQKNPLAANPIAAR